MESNELNIAWCYPDMLNLHGDRGNIMALERIGKMLGLNVNVKKIESFQTEINFDKTDILFFNVGEIRIIESIVDALNKQKEELDRFIENNKMIIAIGTTGAAFGKKLIKLDGKQIDCLGYLDMDCNQRDMVYGNDIIFKLNEDESVEINGNQIQMLDIKTNGATILGTVSYGRGNNGEDKGEGAKYKNLVFTNTLGPVLVKNPWYTEKLIKTAMATKGIQIENSIPDTDFEVERKSIECIKEYNAKKEKK
ncbi:MAG: hypothetical protein IKP28_06765 [Clostridia bacterium]|nr:hypothetical protein [Clostridia bacterium]